LTPNEVAAVPDILPLSADATSMHRMPFGAEIQPDGEVHFRVWAPEASSLQLALEDAAELLAMVPVSDGWYELTTAAARAGSRYRFVLPNGLHVPDPVSRFQPDDVNGPSAVVDARSYTWRTLDWKGRPWAEAVLYELHVGTFTPRGTFRAAQDKLDHLVSLGITAIEIMSIGDFPGARTGDTTEFCSTLPTPAMAHRTTSRASSTRPTRAESWSSSMSSTTTLAQRATTCRSCFRYLY
jgi:1,4-alpha-glucan branching enzyme